MEEPTKSHQDVDNFLAWFLPVAAVSIAAMVFLVIAILTLIGVMPSEVISGLAGMLISTGLQQVYQFRYGSSEGSKEKTKAITDEMERDDTPQRVGMPQR